MKSSYFENSSSSLATQMSSIHGIRSYLNAYKRTSAAYVENGFYERSSGNANIKTANLMKISKYDFDAKCSLDKSSINERGSATSISERNQANVAEMRDSPQNFERINNYKCVLKPNQDASLMSSTRPRAPVSLSIFKDGRLEEDLDILSCASTLCSLCKAEIPSNSEHGNQKTSSSFDPMDSYASKTEAVGQRILANFALILSSAQPKEPNLPGCGDKASLGLNPEDDLDNCSSDGSLCSQCQASNPDDGVSKENGMAETPVSGCDDKEAMDNCSGDGSLCSLCHPSNPDEGVTRENGLDGIHEPLSHLELGNNYKAKTEAVGRRIIENFELILSSIGKSGLNSPACDSKATKNTLNKASSEISSCSHCHSSNPKSDVAFENDVCGIQEASPSFESTRSESPDKVGSPRVDSTNFQRVLSWLQDLNPAEYDDVAAWNGDTHYAPDNSSETSLCSCCQPQEPNLDLNGSREYSSYRVQKTPPSFKQIPNGNFDAEIVAQRFSPNFQRVRRFAKEGRQKTPGHPDEFLRNRKNKALSNFSSDNSSSQINRRTSNLLRRLDYGAMLYGP
ncbi:hypothetical protein JTE90_002926 [Oedothorax gibbosus]|uniref:Uncharacterized protein n=1 Tax=Oedothorax gibbosus TaxID=931172 RepID=A0AAV6UUA5_9ARAC|nr:hypothetical protein JTE90_002926 [Oedothorax gibbosus]